PAGSAMRPCLLRGGRAGGLVAEAAHGVRGAALPGRHARELEAHLDSRQRAHEHESAEIAARADAEPLAGDAPEAAAEGHVEVLEHRRAKAVGVVALRKPHAGQRRRVVSRLDTLHLEAPGLDRAPGRLAVTEVTLEHLLETFLVQHVDGLGETV